MKCYLLLGLTHSGIVLNACGSSCNFLVSCICWYMEFENFTLHFLGNGSPKKKKISKHLTTVITVPHYRLLPLLTMPCEQCLALLALRQVYCILHIIRL